MALQGRAPPAVLRGDAYGAPSLKDGTTAAAVAVRVSFPRSKTILLPLYPDRISSKLLAGLNLL